MHYALCSLKIQPLKMGKTPSQNPNQPKLSLYRV
nr:MAG TPA: hypothetical protein [Caudoviricetes sp.]